MNEPSWEGFERFLNEHSKSCAKWLPLLRDGHVEFSPAHARLGAQGEVEAVKMAETMTIQTTFRANVATTTKAEWLAECARIQAAYPALGRGGKSGVKAALLREEAGKVLPYDSG